MEEDRRLDRYRELRRTNPELFAEPEPADGAIEIVLDPAEAEAAEAAAAARLAATGQPAAWARTGVVFEDQYGTTIRDPVRMPDGGLGTYIRRVNTGNAPGVVVLPVLDGQVLLLRHFRHPTRQWHLELPRGFGTPGRSPAENARRELREEIGAAAGDLVDLGIIYPDTGVSGTPVQLYLTGIAEYGEPDIGEGITGVELVPPDRLGELIATGEITDGYTINAYARAVLRGHLPLPRPDPRRTA
ncbi:MAG TPA: NUDIX hydrolase [Micromonosporaceae bacterium]|nr:NUDIX hydrolase [Micromonosporaceae bacterium]